MAKEKFLIIAERIPDDCFGRFSETENRAALDAGTADTSDAYSWIEASYEIKLVRHREATHLCSFTPSAYYVWLANAFVGEPNAAWERDGDPEGLEHESGGEYHGYGTYRDDYDSRYICATIVIDTMRDLAEPLRKPAERSTLSHRSESLQERLEAYHMAIWEAAEQVAHEVAANGGFWCDILDTYTWRQAERAKLTWIRHQALDDSRRGLHGMIMGVHA